MDDCKKMIEIKNHIERILDTDNQSLEDLLIVSKKLKILVTLLSLNLTEKEFETHTQFLLHFLIEMGK